MCLLNQRLLLTEAGRGDGHGEDWICLVPVLSEDGRREAPLAPPRFTTSNPLEYHMNEQWEIHRRSGC